MMLFSESKRRIEEVSISICEQHGVVVARVATGDSANVPLIPNE